MKEFFLKLTVGFGLQEKNSPPGTALKYRTKNHCPKLTTVASPNVILFTQKLGSDIGIPF
jgi:hypothetical protein